MEKTASGLQENVASFLCYLFWWVTGLVFLLVEPSNKTVRFHAIQSICFSVVVVILSIIIGIAAAIFNAIVVKHVSFLGFFVWLLWFAFWGLVFIVWILLMVRAYQEQKWKLPIIGDIATKWAGI